MLFLFTLFLACESQENKPETSLVESESIRIGWQTTWATQGQLAVLLQQSPWLANLNFEPSFVGFSYGAPLNEGALAGEVDVLFTADQPALVLCSKNNDWGAIGRLMYNRVGTLVPSSSSIDDPKDLHSASVAIPIGAAAHRETLAAIQPSDPSTLQIYNMGVQEIAALVGGGEENGKWGTLDAVSAWDPVLAELELNHGAKAIDYGQVTSLVMMSAKYQEKYPDAAKRFMTALDQAYASYQSDPNAADQAFIQQAQLSTSPEALKQAASIEPNLKANAPIRTWLNDADTAALQEAADFMHSVKILKNPLQAEDCLRPLSKAKK